MTSQEGVKNVILSGMRATVVMEEGQELSETKVKDALGSKSLKFVSMETVERPAPKVMFNTPAKGVT